MKSETKGYMYELTETRKLKGFNLPVVDCLVFDKDELMLDRFSLMIDNKQYFAWNHDTFSASKIERRKEIEALLNRN